MTIFPGPFSFRGRSAFLIPSRVNVLSGGTTMFQEIGERISMELQVQWLGSPRWCCLYSSAACTCRQMARSAVKNGLNKWCSCCARLASANWSRLSCTRTALSRGSLKPNDVTIVLEIELDCVQIRSYCRLAGFARAWASADGGVLAFRT